MSRLLTAVFALLVLSCAGVQTKVPDGWVPPSEEPALVEWSHASLSGDVSAEGEGVFAVVLAGYAKGAPVQVTIRGARVEGIWIGEACFLLPIWFGEICADIGPGGLNVDFGSGG